MSKIIEILLFNITWIKKKVFGSSYLEGKWIGCYRGLDGNPNYYIEYFEQTFDGLVIRGKCFSSTLEYKGCWISDRVIVDDVKGIITYTYETDMINSTHKNQGLATFNFGRKSAKICPETLFGFSSDIFATKKLISLERKMDAKDKSTEQELIAKSKALYIENNNYFCR